MCTGMIATFFGVLFFNTWSPFCLLPIGILIWDMCLVIRKGVFWNEQEIRSSLNTESVSRWELERELYKHLHSRKPPPSGAKPLEEDFKDFILEDEFKVT